MLYFLATQIWVNCTFTKVTNWFAGWRKFLLPSFGTPKFYFYSAVQNFRITQKSQYFYLGIQHEDDLACMQ